MNDVVNACKLFSQIDVNGDGEVTQKELLKGLKNKIKGESLEKDISAIYKNLDMDNNGFIEYEEFVRAASKEKFLTDNVLRILIKMVLEKLLLMKLKIYLKKVFLIKKISIQNYNK